MKYDWTLILATLGFLLANYVRLKTMRNEKLVCVVGNDCNKVVRSKYGRTFGMDNTILGMLYYLFLITAMLIILTNPVVLDYSLFSVGLLISAGLAALFSLYLTFIQVFVLKELCEYCLFSSVLVIIIFIILI
jgi:uncharacterized membrane protein